jgi:hypothetical protein
MPPMSAKGTMSRIITCWRTEPKGGKQHRKMMTIDRGTTSARRAVARAWCSNCPPHAR